MHFYPLISSSAKSMASGYGQLMTFYHKIRLSRETEPPRAKALLCRYSIGIR
jgi:hypothetical protein